MPKTAAMTIALTLAAAIAQPVKAQDEGAGIRLNGVVEHYFGASVNGPDTYGELAARWIQINGKSGDMGITLGTFSRPNFQALDENFVKLDRRGRQWRFGRLRSRFGHSEWDDQWYNGFANQPLMRLTRFAPGFMLARFDTGIDFGGGDSALEYRVGLVDPTAGKNDVLARRPNHFVARIQTYKAGVILGLSALTRADSSQTRLVNLDWRWSSPQWILRGELLRGRVKGLSASGQYLDVYFHPIKQFRTTLIARIEESTNQPGFGQDPGPGYDLPGAPIPESAPASRLVTLGVKQILSREITLSATHGWGNRSSRLRGVTGWALQAIHFLRF